MAAILRDSVPVVAVVVRTLPRAIPVALITMRKSTYEYGAPLSNPFGLPELRYKPVVKWFVEKYSGQYTYRKPGIACMEG